ncbi:unnamed protein product [Blepharisma stoltei]|uniref:Secreted protein n=1 Tax=Blepharisma stoltei TaxID=1481888 RepID=A0AAU9J9M7_9CILI|nr:unnamed protein product [Blepharisma stoltei]
MAKTLPLRWFKFVLFFQESIRNFICFYFWVNNLCSTKQHATELHSLLKTEAKKSGRNIVTKLYFRSIIASCTEGEEKWCSG